MALAPFVALAVALGKVPTSAGLQPLPWWQAAAYAAALLGLMGIHAACYARWTPHAPNRMLVNEFLTRSWFVLSGLLVVSLRGDTGPIYLVMGSAWGVASWCTHYLVLRSQKEYRPLENLAQLGLFLFGLSLMGLLAVRIALAA